MRKFGTFCLATSLVTPLMALVAHAQFAAPNPEELKMTADPKAPGADAVYLVREEMSDDPHHFRTVYARIKVLTERGKEAATVHITYNRSFVFNASGSNSSRMGAGTSNHWEAPNVNHAGEDQPFVTDSFQVKTDVSAIEGRTIHADGTVVPLTGNPSDLLVVKRGRNQMDDMAFTLPAVEVGSVLEYKYQIRYDRFEEAPDWQIQQPYFVHRAHYSFTPAEKFNPMRNKGGAAGVEDSALLDGHGEIITDIQYAPVLPPGKSVHRDASGVYTLDLSDIAPIPSESFAPPVASQTYQVNFFYTPTADERDFWQKEMGYWMRALTQYTAPTATLKSTVQEVTTGSDSPLEKAKKLYSVVAKLENIDFTPDGEPGIGSEWIPSGSVEKVLQEKKGTSNQMAYLYLALAKTAGLNARPERIASRSRRIFSPHLLRTDQLDSVVISLEIDGKDVTVDPGAKMAPFQTVHWSHSGAGGVTVGKGGKVETLVTPLQMNTDNAVLRVGTLALGTAGQVSGSLKVAFLGQQALLYRQLALRSGADVVKQEIERNLRSEAPSTAEVHVDHLAYVDDPTKQLIAVVPVSGTLGTRSENRLMLPRLFFATREQNPLPDEESRILPVDMRYPGQEQEQITYTLPTGYTVEGKPEDSVFKWEENAAYQLKSKASPGSITNARVLVRGFTLLDANEYKPLREFYQKAITTDRQEIVLSTTQAASAQ